MARRVYAIVFIMLLGACAHYAPQPRDVGAIEEGRKAANIDPEAVRRELARLAPGKAFDAARWDETSLLAAAFAYNPDLRSARAGAEAAKAEAKAARVAPGPALTLTAEYAFNPTEASPWLFSLASDQLLDLGGRRRARIADADIAAKAAEYALENAAWNALSEIEAAVGAVKASSEVAALYDKIAPLRARQLAALRNQVREGAAASLDLERIRQAAGNDASMAAAARAQARSSRLALAKAVGVAPDAIEGLELAPPALRETPETSPDIRAQALRARPEILDAIVAYDRSEEALRAAVAAQYPEIRIGPGYTWERGLSKLPFSLTLSFPSADFGAAAVKAAEARREEAARKLEAAVAAAEQNVDAAFENVRAAREAVEILRDQSVAAARAIAAQADRAIALGAMDRATWADAKIGELTSAIDLVRAEQGLRAANAALGNALRRSLDGSALDPAALNMQSGC